MKENKQKVTRRTPEAIAFHAEMEPLIKLKPRLYAERALVLFPHLDRAKLHYAVAGRAVYWPAIKALRVVCGLEKMPNGHSNELQHA